MCCGRRKQGRRPEEPGGAKLSRSPKASQEPKTPKTPAATAAVDVRKPEENVVKTVVRRLTFRPSKKRRPEAKAEEERGDEDGGSVKSEATQGSGRAAAEPSVGRVRELVGGGAGRRPSGEAPSAFRRRSLSQMTTRRMGKTRRPSVDALSELADEDAAGDPGLYAAGKWMGLRDGKQLADDVKVLRDPADTPGPPSAALKANDTDKESRKLQVNTAFNQFCTLLPLSNPPAAK